MREGVPCLKILTIVVVILRQAHHFYGKEESKWDVKSFSLKKTLASEEERDKFGNLIGQLADLEEGDIFFWKL